jgi:hypothetical protein
MKARHTAASLKGSTEDISKEFLELARRGLEDGDQQAQMRLLFNEPVVSAVLSLLNGSFAWKTDALAGHRGEQTRRRGPGAEQVYVEFALWIAAKNARFKHIYDAAKDAGSFDVFCRYAATGATVRNLLRDFFDTQLRDHEERVDTDVEAIEEQWTQHEALPPTELESGKWRYEELQKLAAFDCDCTGQDVYRPLCVRMMWYTYCGEIGDVPEQELTRGLGPLPDGFDRRLALLQHTYRANVRKIRDTRDEHLRNAINRTAVFDAANERANPQSTRGTSLERAAERDKLEALAAKHNRARAQAERELRKAEAKFLSEKRIQILLCLKSVGEGRNLLKRAKARFRALIAQVKQSAEEGDR